jgi:hypothetical protein
MRKYLVAVAVAALAADVFAVKGTIVTDSASMTGEITYQRRQKSYLVAYKKGNNTVQAEYPVADVVKLDIPKPAGFDKLVEQVNNNQGSSAIPGLNKIVTDYYMLSWDKVACKYLALAYVSAGQAQKGLDVCQSIINEDKTAAYTGDLAPAYWTCLMKLGDRNDLLERCLAKAATSGSRNASAAALIMRGDMIVNAGGDKPEVLKQALRDGYMRVALMYGDCPDEKVEAMNRAANCFDKLGQASRAERLRAQTK